jgi:SDR family mycofactocin-dependent oxidoreductase
MTGRVAGKVAFVTGAARGQGRAHAVRLAEEGADIVALDICGPIKGREGIPASSAEDLAETARLVEAADRRVLTFQGDTRAFGDVRHAVDAGVAEFGHLDIAIANAGTAGGSALAHEISEEDWQTTLDINLTGAWHTAKAVLPHMIAAGNGGSIILTSSGAGVKAMLHLADYAASKAGILMLTRVLALENGQHGIRVNSIAPGNVDTPLLMNDVIFALFRPDLEHPAKEDVQPLFEAMNPLKTKAWLSPRDIANAAVWLCSEEAAAITGITLPVDLGSLAG